MKKLNNILALLILSSCSHQEIKPSVLSGLPQAISSIPKTINNINPSYNEAINFGTWKLNYNTDTEALQAAIDSEKSIFFPDSTYVINERINFTSSNSHYLGESKEGVILKFGFSSTGNRLGDVRADSVKFEDISFSGSNYDSDAQALLEVGTPWEVPTRKVYQYIKLVNCIVKDIQGNSDSNYGVRVWIDRVKNFTFDGVEFENISCYNSDNSQTGAGFAGGILLWSPTPAENISDSINGSINGTIQNCLFKNIYTEATGGDINLSDADGIRLTAIGSDNEAIVDPFNINITNNLFEGVEKSAIKISDGKGISINSTTVKSTAPADNNDMIAAIRIQPAIDVTITNTIVEGPFKFIMHLRGQNITVDGIQKGLSDYEVKDTFDGGSAVVQIGKNDSIQNKNITIQNIEDGNVRKILKLRDNGNLLDTGITLRNVNLNHNMSYHSNLGGGQARIEIRESDNVLLENIEVLDWGTGTRCVTIIDSKNVTILDSHLYAKEIGIETRFTSDPNTMNTLTIDGSVFKRGNHSNSTLRFAYLRPLKIGSQIWGEIGKVKITNSSFHAYGFDQTANTESALIGAKEVELSNVQFYFTPGSGQLLPNSGVHIKDADKVLVENITLSTSPVYEGGMYAVLAVGSSDSDPAVDIKYITSTNRGVWLKSCTDVEVDTASISCPGIKLLEI